MTVERLRQYRSLRAEITELTAQKRTLENPDVVQDVVQGSDADFPYIKHNIKVEGTENCPETLAEIERKLKEIRAEFHKLNKFINDIEDSELRRIFRMRYIDGRTFQQIAFRIGYTDEQLPRKKHNKFLKSTKSTKIP